MRIYQLTALVLSACMLANGEFGKKEMKQLCSNTEIAGVSAHSVKNDNRERIEILEINTFQNQDQTAGFQLQIAVELEDAQNMKYLAEITVDQPGGLDRNYLGEDYWELHMPYGDLKRLKVRGYAVQYGVLDGDIFVVLAEDYDGVKSLTELKAQTEILFPGKISLKHSYMYDDQNDGETQTLFRTLRGG